MSGAALLRASPASTASLYCPPWLSMPHETPAWAAPWPQHHTNSSANKAGNNAWASKKLRKSTGPLIENAGHCSRHSQRACPLLSYSLSSVFFALAVFLGAASPSSPSLFFFAVFFVGFS